MSDDLDRFKATYFEECAELLEAVYADLTRLADGSADAETLHAIFRGFHSIKGGGGAFGFARLVAYAHECETLLDLLREGRVVAGAAEVALLVRATDALSDLVIGARTGLDPDADFEAPLIAALRAAAGRAPDKDSAIQVHGSASDATGPACTLYQIHFEPAAALFHRGQDPLFLLRALAPLGTLTVEADLSRLPPFERLDPEEAYLGFTATLRAEVPRVQVEEVFDFVVDDCIVAIADAAATAPVAASETPARQVGPYSIPPTGLPAGTAAGSAAHAEPPAQSIRVEVGKMDRVVNLVGELVINQSMLSALTASLPPELCPGLTNGFEMLSQHLRELQESIMAMRAQPVRSVFARMPRLVREVADQLGKDVRLITTGEATEIDKTVIEQLADPLTHLLRNALDHGIESPEDRLVAGKPAQGTIHLAAEQRSGRIVIEVSDDGRGIDRARVLAKAQARGLVAEDAVIPDEEIDELIFAPGFSTAETVSNISGRGVGMDVVRRNIHALGGRITVRSRGGMGSRFILSLPLTLAVLDGMAVAVAGETYIVPLVHIIESLRPRAGDIHPIVGHGDVLAIRGEFIPLVHLRRFLAPDASSVDPCQAIVMIVESEGAPRYGLVVDELLGQQQVVVKSLEANYDPVDGVGGATILGTGRVALILDVARLCALGAGSLATVARRVPEAAAA